MRRPHKDTSAHASRRPNSVVPRSLNTHQVNKLVASIGSVKSGARHGDGLRGRDLVACRAVNTGNGSCCALTPVGLFIHKYSNECDREILHGISLSQHCIYYHIAQQ